MNRTDWTPTFQKLSGLPLETGAGSGTAVAVAEIRRPNPQEEPEEYSVLVCESQPITAEGVRALLEDSPPLKFAAGCDSLAACRDLVRRVRPNVVILDKALGMQAVLDWLADIRLSSHEFGGQAAALVPINVVVWGVSMTEAEALRFLQGGAKGIVRKTVNPELLVSCLKTVAGGRNWMEDSVFGESARQERSPRSALTPREQQVMELVEQGMKNREIARELGIRPGTVKIHLKHIFEKTGVRGRYGLALTGMRQKGVISIDTDEDDDNLSAA